jgi:hypothetical protein
VPAQHRQSLSARVRHPRAVPRGRRAISTLRGLAATHSRVATFLRECICPRSQLATTTHRPRLRVRPEGPGVRVSARRGHPRLRCYGRTSKIEKRPLDWLLAGARIALRACGRSTPTGACYASNATGGHRRLSGPGHTWPESISILWQRMHSAASSHVSAAANGVLARHGHRRLRCYGRTSTTEGPAIHPFQNILAPALFDCFREKTRSISNAPAPSAGATAELWKGSKPGHIASSASAEDGTACQLLLFHRAVASLGWLHIRI